MRARLVEHRRALGLSLRAAADDSGVPFNTLSRVEKGPPADLANFSRLELEQKLARDDQQRATKRIAKLTDQRSKLLTAHYGGAVPVDLLKTEMEPLTRDSHRQERARRSACHARRPGRTARAGAGYGWSVQRAVPTCPTAHPHADQPRTVQGVIPRPRRRHRTCRADRAVPSAARGRPALHGLRWSPLERCSPRRRPRQQRGQTTAVGRPRCCTPSSLPARHAKHPSRICRGAVCTTFVWCARWDSNLHHGAEETAVERVLSMMWRRAYQALPAPMWM